MTEPRILTKDDFLHLEHMACRRWHDANDRRETIPCNSPAWAEAHSQARAEAGCALSWLRRAGRGNWPTLPR
jgi:hypothetical protein